MAPKRVGGAKMRALASVEHRERSRSPQAEASSSTTRKGGGVRQRALRQAGAGDCGGDVPRDVSGHVDDQPNVTAFRNHVSRLFLKNRFSGAELLTLVKAAETSGTAGIHDLASSNSLANAARDVFRKLRKCKNLPEVYWVDDVPLHDVKTNATVYSRIPVLLPHEMLSAIMQSIDTVEQVLSDDLRKLKQDICGKLGLDAASTLVLGLHGDGVPHQKKKSIECLSWNILSDESSHRYLFPQSRNNFVVGAVAVADTPWRNYCQCFRGR